jgi:hypothetical protein
MLAQRSEWQTLLRHLGCVGHLSTTQRCIRPLGARLCQAGVWLQCEVLHLKSALLPGSVSGAVAAITPNIAVWMSCGLSNFDLGAAVMARNRLSLSAQLSSEGQKMFSPPLLTASTEQLMQSVGWAWDCRGSLLCGKGVSAPDQSNGHSSAELIEIAGLLPDRSTVLQ